MYQVKILILIGALISTTTFAVNCENSARVFALKTAKRIASTSDCSITNLQYGLDPEIWDQSSCNSGECYDVSVECQGKDRFRYPIEATISSNGRCSLDFTQ